MISVTIYKGKGNEISLGLMADGAYSDISAANRMTLQVGDLLVDSVSHASAFDWATNGANGQVDIDIAGINGLDKGQFRCQLTIYDATYPNGLVWDEFIVTVK